MKGQYIHCFGIGAFADEENSLVADRQRFIHDVLASSGFVYTLIIKNLNFCLLTKTHFFPSKFPIFGVKVILGWL